MRIRSRNLPQDEHTGGTFHQKFYDVSSGSMYFEHDDTNVGVHYSLGQLDETISDSKNPKPNVNTVVHDYRSSMIKPCPLSIYHINNGATRIEISSGALSLWEDMNVRCPYIDREHLLVTYTKTKEQLLSDAISSFYEVNEVDNLLNIAEGGQTLDMMKDIGQFLSNVFHGKLNPRGLKLRQLSNAYLGYSFGIAPLVSDLKKLSREIPRLRGRLREAASKAQAPKTVTKSCKGTIAFQPLSLAGYSPVTDAPGTGGWWREQLIASPPLLVSGVYGRRSVEFKSSTLQQIDYLLSRFVATGPASFAWEKVPFSFVSDWFVDLSSVLDKMDNTLTGGGKSIQYAWTSEKIEANIGVLKRQTGSNNYNEYEGHQVANVELSHYHRNPVPADTSVRLAGRFGKKQASLSLALIHQSVANLKRKR